MDEPAEPQGTGEQVKCGQSHAGDAGCLTGMGAQAFEDHDPQQCGERAEQGRAMCEQGGKDQQDGLSSDEPSSAWRGEDCRPSA